MHFNRRSISARHFEQGATHTIIDILARWAARDRRAWRLAKKSALRSPSDVSSVTFEPIRSQTSAP